MSRNPNWTRDELILALDLYFKVDPSRSNETNPAIVELSILLNKLPIHQESRDRQANFRNPNSVYMKLENFRHLDPNAVGKGLDAGGKLDRIVWDEFAADRERLGLIAKAIRQEYTHLQLETPEIKGEIDAEEFPEGRLLTRIHMLRERNSTVVKKKKKAVMDATGQLACEVCSFDFQQVYGELGKGFAECHHTVPVAELQPGQATRLADLVIVCANCHRMLHRARPVLTVAQLRAQLIISNTSKQT